MIAFVPVLMFSSTRRGTFLVSGAPSLESCLRYCTPTSPHFSNPSRGSGKTRSSAGARKPERLHSSIHHMISRKAKFGLHGWGSTFGHMDRQSSDSLFCHSFIPADGAIISMIINFLLSRNGRLFSLVGPSPTQALRVKANKRFAL